MDLWQGLTGMGNGGQDMPCTGVRGLLQPLLGCALHDQRYPSGRIDNGQTVFLTSPGAPVKGLKIGAYGCDLVVVSGPLEMARQDTR